MPKAKVIKIDENTQSGQSPSGRYKVTIRRDLCIGAVTCSAIASKTFAMDEDNIAYLTDDEWDEDEIILAAAQSCPVFAIIVEDLKTGKQIFPEPID